MAIPKLGRSRPMHRPEAAREALAMVLLPTAAPFDAPAALRVVHERWPEDPHADNLVWDAPAGVARIPGGQLGFAHMPVPIPAADLRGPAQLARWHWPDAEAAAAAHQTHVVVFARSGELPPTALRLLHTRVIAAALEVAGGLGVYVGDALLLRAAAAYADDAARSSAQLPIYSWLGVHPVGWGDGRLAAYTQGLAAFGLRELEAAPSRRAAGDVVALLANLAHYQLASGARVGDGETVGGDLGERIRVRYRRSAVVPNRDVALLELA